MSRIYLLFVLLYLHTSISRANNVFSKSIVGIFDHEELRAHFAEAVSIYANNKTK